jgi:type VI secretion system protein VasD
MVPKWLEVALLALLMGGCPKPPPSPVAPPPPCTDPEPVRLYLSGTERLNPGEHGEPLATVVRVYQLKASGHLNEANFEDILDRDKQTLAEELVASKEMTLNPGDQLDPQIVRGDGAAWIGVVALFRQPAGTSWRALYRLPAPDPYHCRPLKRGRRPPRVYQAFFDENRVEIR